MTTTFEDILEKIETIIEGIEPSKLIRISEIAKRANVTMDSATRKATIMLLKKYGIKYAKEGD